MKPISLIGKLLGLLICATTAGVVQALPPGVDLGPFGIQQVVAQAVAAGAYCKRLITAVGNPGERIGRTQQQVESLVR